MNSKEFDPFWRFQSGFDLQYGFILLGFLENISPQKLEWKVRNRRKNILKPQKKSYPKLTACLFYLWDKHGKGRTYKASKYQSPRLSPNKQAEVIAEQRGYYYYKMSEAEKKALIWEIVDKDL